MEQFDAYAVLRFAVVGTLIACLSAYAGVEWGKKLKEQEIQESQVEAFDQEREYTDAYRYWLIHRWREGDFLDE